MNICIGGDLDGRVIVLDKPCFNAKEVNKTKSTNYIKQMYVIDGEVILPFLIDLISRKPKSLSLFKFRWFTIN